MAHALCVHLQLFPTLRLWHSVNLPHVNTLFCVSFCANMVNIKLDFTTVWVCISLITVKFLFMYVLAIYVSVIWILFHCRIDFFFLNYRSCLFTLVNPLSVMYAPNTFFLLAVFFFLLHAVKGWMDILNFKFV